MLPHLHNPSIEGAVDVADDAACIRESPIDSDRVSREVSDVYNVDELRARVVVVQQVIICAQGKQQGS